MFPVSGRVFSVAPVPAAVPAPVSGRSSSSIVLRFVAPPLTSPLPVRTSPTLLPLSRKLRFVSVAEGVALLLVVVVAIAFFWRPPGVHGLLVRVWPPMSDTVVWLKGTRVLGEAGSEDGRRKWRVGRAGVVQGIWRVVSH